MPASRAGRRQAAAEAHAAAPVPGSAAPLSAGLDRDRVGGVAGSREAEAVWGFAPPETGATCHAWLGSASQLASNAAQPKKAARGWVTTNVGISPR
jgi:hypothetical protein